MPKTFTTENYRMDKFGLKYSRALQMSVSLQSYNGILTAQPYISVHSYNTPFHFGVNGWLNCTYANVFMAVMVQFFQNILYKCCSNYII